MLSVSIKFPLAILAGLVSATALDRATFTSFSPQGPGASCSGAKCTFKSRNTYGLDPGPPMIFLDSDYLLTWAAADPAFPFADHMAFSARWALMGTVRMGNMEMHHSEHQNGTTVIFSSKVSLSYFHKAFMTDLSIDVSGGASSGSYIFSPSIVLAKGFPNPSAPNITDGTQALGYASQSFDLGDEKKYKFNYFAISQPDTSGSHAYNFAPSDPFTLQPREAETIVRAEKKRERDVLYHKWAIGVGIGVGVGLGLPMVVYMAVFGYRWIERRRAEELSEHT